MTKIIQSEQEFEEAISGKAVVDFFATWCPPCRMFSPIIEELAAEYEGKITIVKLNVDELRSVARKYGIKSIPTAMFFKNGAAVGSVTGLQDKDYMIKLIEEHLN